MMKKIFQTALLLILNISLINNILADNSVLADGTWYKLSVASTGMYSLTYSDLAEMGVNVSNVNPKNIRLFHNGGGVLPIINKNQTPDDLVEIPILIIGEEDDHFDDGDIIIFYARGPVTWEYDPDNNFYQHVKNSYSDYSYVFMTIGNVAGKRITTASKPTGSAITVTDFLDGQVNEIDEYNLNNMGRTWYFDKFDVTLERTYPFDFPNVITSKNAKMRAETAARNPSSVTFKYTVGGTVVATQSLSAMGSTQYTYAQTSSTYVKSFSPTSATLDVDLKFSRSGSSSVGWLDYIEMNAWRRLAMTYDVMPFRNPECNDASQVYEYQIANASNSLQVWDVTNPVEPKKMNTTLNASTLTFNSLGSENSEFIAFNGNSFSKPEFVEMVANQNLHAMKDIDYLIIAHPNFVSHAQRLKQIHSRLDDLVIDIVEPQTIYNEFSCGALDIAAIRNFIKMLYTNSSAEHKLKYVLLFGDASYAYKNSDVCFIPTYESVRSCSITACIATDDFYVCLDPDEGDMESGSIIDLAVARMPVSTTIQATAVLDKLEAFVDKNQESMSKWRNMLTLVCDDAADGGTHFIKNSETIADSISRWGGDMVVEKIYLDTYNQIATASGQRCPEANEAITNRIENGTFLVNYIGHGGEVGWGEECFLTNDDINSWQNLPMLPIFLTATCEFSRYDDHTRTSAGELVYLNAKGGAINMVTTARTTQGSESMKLLRRFYRSIFKMYDGEYQRIGDVFLAAKQDAGQNTKVYALFGDPALRIAYPKNNVILTKINGNEVGLGHADTLKALSHIALEGEIRDNFGVIMNDFNGIVQVTAYDKENTIYTKGDHDADTVAVKVRNSIIFNGKTTVENGRFTIEFTVPKDIRYNYGDGLINFYATDYHTDANGSYSDIVVGGYDSTVIPDADGPEIRVFIDDTLFVDGNITNENPVIIAKIRDVNGINTSGAGIGHDIMAVLSGATNKSYNLNNYYEAPASLDEFGNLTYRLYNLSEGEHTLRFRAWDIYNNSTTVSVNFTVVKSDALAIQNLVNVPNPMSDYTRIMFEYNQKSTVNVNVRIYNINGQLVKTIEESRDGTSMRIEPIIWDGTTDYGNALPSGIYIYNVTISNSDNEKASDFSKLVITR